MAAPTDPAPTAAERLIAATIQATWVLWLAGGLYVVGPLLGWTLAGMATWRLYLGQPAHRCGWPTGLWLAGMAAMLLVLMAGHAANGLDAGQTLKSAAGWAKGWALLALFPFAGAVLPIRGAVIHRALCRLGLQTLIVLPLFLLAPFAGLPGRAYVSPLQVLGGSGPEYFAVVLYTLEPGSGVPRWQFFAPWAPAAGIVAVVLILAALAERRAGWRAIGIAAGVAMALLSQSRLALVAALIVWPLSLVVAHIRRPAVAFAAAPALLLAGLAAPWLSRLAEQAADDFAGARADSSRVRAALGRIALDRWRGEAPWVGHGVVERGPHLVEYMPIGSHHSWYGLLFVKGVLGVAALALPLGLGLVAAGRRAHLGPDQRLAFALLLVLFLYTFGENLEVLGYLIWPGLMLIGIGDRRDQATAPV